MFKSLCSQDVELHWPWWLKWQDSLRQMVQLIQCDYVKTEEANRISRFCTVCALIQLTDARPQSAETDVVLIFIRPAPDLHTYLQYCVPLEHDVHTRLCLSMFACVLPCKCGSMYYSQVILSLSWDATLVCRLGWETQITTWTCACVCRCVCFPYTTASLK